MCLPPAPPNVLFKRVEDSTQLDNIPVVDGSFYVTGDGKIFIDYGEERIPVSGDTLPVGGDTLPIGVILPLSSDTIPEGYLLCDGSEISRTTYATLFGVIGTTYGSGDGSTTFNLPNLKGKVPVGLNSSDTDFDTIGGTGGGKQTIIPMQWYTDFIDMRIKTGINIPNWENFRKNASGSTAGGLSENSNSAVMGINENTTVDTNGNLQPYIVVKYIIKVLNAQSGEIRSESLPVGTELDYDGETVPTGWEQIDDPNSYSTTETICGTWIDGKPIYRTVIQTSTATSTGSWTKIANIQIDTLVRKFGYWITGSEKYPLDRSYNNEEMTTYWKADGIYEIHNYSYANNKQAILIVEYTKPTN